METLVMSPGKASLDKLRQVADYLADFQPDFPRRDQLRWAAVYVHGLLSKFSRKNIETMARRLVLPTDWPALDAKQALQNFINQSPWDENRLWRRHRVRLAEMLGQEGGLFVIQEVPFVIQGRHSVGVHRQFSAVLCQKVNCQVAVAIHYVSAAGHGPLALRLYLPHSWLQAPGRLEAAGVPESYRRPASKLDIALELLDELRDEKFPGKFAAAPGFAPSPELTEGLAQHGLAYLGDEAKVTGIPDPSIPWKTYLHLAEKDLQRMKNDLGLDHFEGRSWRGFHHHACLVALAFGYLLK